MALHVLYRISLHCIPCRTSLHCIEWHLLALYRTSLPEPRRNIYGMKLQERIHGKDRKNERKGARGARGRRHGDGEGREEKGKPGAREPFFNRGSRSKSNFYNVTGHVDFHKRHMQFLTSAQNFSGREGQLIP